jgi:hypothetical protein
MSSIVESSRQREVVAAGRSAAVKLMTSLALNVSLAHQMSQIPLPALAREYSLKRENLIVFSEGIFVRGGGFER